MKKKIHKLFTRPNSLAMTELYFRGIWEYIPKRIGFQFSIFVVYCSEGMVEVYRNIQEQSEDFVQHIISTVQQDNIFLDELIKEYENNFETIRNITQRTLDFNTKQEVLAQLNKLEEFFLPSAAETTIISWLQKKNDTDEAFANRYIAITKEASRLRKETEGLYAFCTTFIADILDAVSERERIPVDLMEMVRLTELKQHLAGADLPSVDILQRRHAGSVIYNNEFYELEGKSLTKFLDERNCEIEEEKIELHDGIRGQTATSGRYQGRVHILKRFRDCHLFEKGEVLVSHMTNQMFLPAIQKAGAIITDEGGTLSHAAIISRELGIPCVVGTQIATKALKNGDKVEVDATNGIIKKI